MKETFKAIWIDPVWSKVIATLVAAAILTSIAALWDKYTKSGFKLSQITVVLPLWFLIVLLVGSFIFSVLILSKVLRSKYSFAPTIKLTGVEVPDPIPNPPMSFPVKCHFTFRNDSQGCIDVAVSDFEPEAVTLKNLPIAVFQIQLNQRWLPEDHGVSRIAVLPGQLFRGWIAPDEDRFSSTQARILVGRLGTLVLSVNGRVVRQKL
jgi:hypothetical protein